MPRLSPSETDKRNTQLKANISYYKVINNRTDSDIADYLALSRPTITRRMAEPESFTIEEIRRLCKLFNINVTTLLEGKAGEIQ